MLASSKSLHDAAIFPHFLNSRTPKDLAKGKSGDWNRIYFISRQMGISRAWKNIKGLSSSSNENYYDSQSRSYVIQWTAGGGNDGGKATIAAYTFGSANYYLRRDMWFFSFLRNFCRHKGKLKPFVTCPSSIFQYFFHSYWGNVHPFTRCSTLTQSHKLKILQKELL